MKNARKPYIMNDVKKIMNKGNKLKIAATNKRPLQKQKTGSRTDWNKLKNIKDRDIDTTEIPELDDSFWSNAIMGSPLRKQLISLRLDKDIINWFKASGPNYQTRINQLLRTYMEWNEQSKTPRIAESQPLTGYSFKNKQS